MCRPGLDSIANHQGLKLVWKVNEEAAGIEVSDTHALASAIQNLVLNALQAGGDHVTVDGARQPIATGGELLLRVIDNGPGPQQPEGIDIFDAFVSGKPEGLGLGLGIVRNACEQLGGSVDWKRDKDGTEFCVHLPVKS